MRAGSLSTERPAGTEVVVRAEDLVVGYRDRIVWEGATFGIGRGEFVAVIGPNGAGKTTLFRLLLGLLRPLRGTLTVFGSEPRRGNARIGYVPQVHALDNATNVAAIHLVRLAHSGNRWGFPLDFAEEKAAATAALESVGASALAGQSLSSLSGGELQRVFLAEAMVSEPDLLLLDEPLSNLDLRRARELVQLVNGLVRSRDVSALLVAHDINPLIHCLDKVIYVANGRVAAGPPDRVLTSESLTRLYGVPVEVLRDSRNNIVIVGGEDPHEGERP